MSVELPLGPCRHCESSQSALRRWEVAAGIIQYRFQCLLCGASRSNAIKHSEIAKPDALGIWDRGLEERYRIANAPRQLELIDLQGRKWREKHAQYEAYLLTDAWRSKRKDALSRDLHMCQGCRRRPATQVHHLTYEHLGNELLWELVSICNECHELAHGDGK